MKALWVLNNEKKKKNSRGVFLFVMLFKKIKVSHTVFT